MWTSTSSVFPYVDRNYEALAIEYLAPKQLVSKYYGRFQNGFVYLCVQGSNPSSDTMKKEDVMRMIVNKLYAIHTAGVPKKSGYNKDKNTAAFYSYISDVPLLIDEDKFEPDIKKRLV